MTDEERAAIDELNERIAKGIAWLDEHDPTGGLYFQWKAGLRAHSRMPKLEGTPEHEDWKRWAQNMALYEQLMGRLERLERRAA